MLMLLLTNKADVTTFNGITPLRVAVEAGDAEATKLLLDNKANVSVTKDYSTAPMCIEWIWSNC